MSADPPEWLAPEARAVWEGLDEGIRTRGDRDALVVYCCAVADFNKAQQLIDRTGHVVRGTKGELVRSPLNYIKQENAATIRHLSRLLGIGGPHDAETAPTRWRNSAATERTLTALRRGGRVDDVDAAATALARHLARALDSVDAARYPAQTASLARVQLAALRTLRGLDEQEGSADLDDLLAALSAPVGDPSQP